MNKFLHLLVHHLRASIYRDGELVTCTSKIPWSARRDWSVRIFGRVLLIRLLAPESAEVWKWRFKRRIAMRAWSPFFGRFSMLWPSWVREYPDPEDWALDESPEDAADEDMSYWTDDGD